MATTKVHWTQTPKGRAFYAAKAAQRRASTIKPTAAFESTPTAQPLVDEYNDLLSRAQRRVREINAEIDRLTHERVTLVERFSLSEHDYAPPQSHAD